MSLCQYRFHLIVIDPHYRCYIRATCCGCLKVHHIVALYGVVGVYFFVVYQMHRRQDVLIGTLTFFVRLTSRIIHYESKLVNATNELLMYRYCTGLDGIEYGMYQHLLPDLVTPWRCNSPSQPSTTCTSSNTTGSIVVPMGRRWIVIPPWKQ
jgi:hypothetical protein